MHPCMSWPRFTLFPIQFPFREIKPQSPSLLPDPESTLATGGKFCSIPPMNSHFYRRSFRPAALLLLLSSILPARPAAADGTPAAPAVAFSLSADSAVSDLARKTWDFWATAQSDPALAAEFAKHKDGDGDHPSHFVRPSPYLALRIDPAPGFDEAAIPPPFLCRFDFYFAPTNALPGLDPANPLFARPPFHTEIVGIPGGLPATVLLPTCIPGEDFLLPAYSKRNYTDRLVVRATLATEGRPGTAPVPLASTVLPPFERETRADILASTNLPAKVWQSADSWHPWTPVSYSATIPDAFPARFPHTAIFSADDFAALADRPVLARRLALAACPVAAHDVRSPSLPADPPLPDNSVLFRAPSTSAKNVSRPDTDLLDHDDPTAFLVPPTTVRRAYPVYAAWISLAFLIAAAAGVVLLVRVFRRAPASRTGLWIAFPAAAFSLALLFLLAGALFLPRTPSADRVLLRVGYAGSPEEWCRASIRCFSFRRTDWEFAFPSAEAGVAASTHLPEHAPCILRRGPGGEDATRLSFPGGIPSTAFTVEGTWFAPAEFPLLVRPAEDFLSVLAHEGAYRTITPVRDLDDLWVVIGTNRYHIGPVAAGTTVRPLPIHLATTNDVIPGLPAPFEGRLPSISGGCGCPDKDDDEDDDESAILVSLETLEAADGETLPAPPAAEIAESAGTPGEAQPAKGKKSKKPKKSSPPPPWITVARAPTIDPWPAGPALTPAGRSTEQTLWITEWP